MQIVPAIDIKQGRCVRLYQGDFDRETVYSDNPLAVATSYQKMGLTSLHVVDLDGAQSGTQSNRAEIQKIAAGTGLSIQLGGGIRDSATFRRWLDDGVERCVIGSLAVEDSEQVLSLSHEFGPARLVLALDVRLSDDGIPWLSTHGWTRSGNVTLWECLDRYVRKGLTRILCTDISRDGALTGPNLGLYAEICRRYPAIDLQASGGVRHASDLHALRNIGVTGAITGRALLDGRIRTWEIEPFLPAA